MARIAHICVSDLHSGADPSLATNLEGGTDDAARNAPSPTSVAFAKAVQGLLTAHAQDQFSAAFAPADKRPALVLLGDLMDLAFSDRGHAGRAYASFLTSLTGGSSALFADDSVFLPGNHDHSLWTGARMAAEAASAATGNIQGLESFTPAVKGKGLPSPLVTAINQRAGMPGTCYVRYPNYAIVSADQRRAVAFHHGHFIDPIYRLMSVAFDALTGDKRRHSAGALASENANWIDFGWSSFGEASDFCKMVNELYTGAENGQEARLLRDRAARMIEDHLVRSLPMGGDPRVHQALRTALAVVIDVTFGAWSDSERYEKTLKLSPAGLSNLATYMENALKPQLRDELGDVPPDMTFVFGHTHKPFVDEIVCPTGPVIPTVNTGGWYLDNVRLDSRDGAALVLINEELDVVSIRYFAVPTNDIVPPVTVRLVSAATTQGEAFRDQIQGYVHGMQADWDSLAATGAAAYKLRQKTMFELMDEMDAEADLTGDLL